MSDPIKIMALGHCAKFNWQWDNMTEARREMARDEMRAVVAALDAAGYAVVPKEATLAMIAASLRTPGMAGVEQMIILQAVRGYPLRREPGEKSPTEQGYSAMVEAGRVVP